MFTAFASLLLLTMPPLGTDRVTVEERVMFARYPAAHKPLPATRPLAVFSPGGRLYQTQLRRLVEAPANFADHARIGVWGCGSGCFSVGIADLTTGQTYYFPQVVVSTITNARLKFNSHSRVVHIAGLFNETTPADRWYAWDGQSLKLIKETKLPAECFTDEGMEQHLPGTSLCNFLPGEE